MYNIQTQVFLTTRTFCEWSGKSQLPQLWLHGVSKLAEWSLFTHHLLRGNEPWPCVIFLLEALEPLYYTSLVLVGEEEAHAALQFLYPDGGVNIYWHSKTVLASSLHGYNVEVLSILFIYMLY